MFEKLVGRKDRFLKRASAVNLNDTPWSCGATAGSPTLSPVGRVRGAGGGSGVAGDRSPLSVIVADDAAPVRAAIIELIEADQRFCVVAQAEGADGAVAAASTHRPDLAVLDVHMPGGGPDAAARIRHASPSTIVVACSAYDDPFSRSQMHNAGAAAYAVKGRDVLLEVVRGVLQLS
jgi:CheY-like chemotaxis protein